jgi:hypothetical protein
MVLFPILLQKSRCLHFIPGGGGERSQWNDPNITKIACTALVPSSQPNVVGCIPKIGEGKESKLVWVQTYPRRTIYAFYRPSSIGVIPDGENIPHC